MSLQHLTIICVSRLGQQSQHVWIAAQSVFMIMDWSTVCVYDNGSVDDCNFLLKQTMQEMNKVMDPQKTAKMMQDFEKESMKMGMSEEMSKETRRALVWVVFSNRAGFINNNVHNLNVFQNNHEIYVLCLNIFFIIIQYLWQSYLLIHLICSNHNESGTHATRQNSHVFIQATSENTQNDLQKYVQKCEFLC